MPLTAEHRIERLHVRLPHGQAQRARDVHQTLMQTTWPELGTEAIVIIRRLYVRSRWDELRQAVTDGVRSAMQNSERHTFANGLALLADLSRDLAIGSAAHHWYWQPWQDLTRQPPETALAILWQRHGELLPAVISALKHMGALPSVWRTLTPNTATLVIEALKAQHEITRNDLFSANESAAISAPHGEEEILLRHQSHHHLGATIDEWRPILAGWSCDDTRVLLAVLLIGIERAPLTILSHHARSWFAVVARALTARTSNPAQSIDVPQPGLAKSGETSAAAPAITNSVERQITANETVSTPRSATLITPSSPPSPAKITATSLSPASDETPPCETTAFAGVVFLINALAQPALRAVIDQAQWFTDVPHGWHVLMNLARYLGLPADDPLAVQLEHLLIESDTHHLTNDERRLVMGAALTGPALALYGDEIWNAGLLRADGHFRLSASHLDVWLPLAAVRLPIRLAGLDLNPGWTPWLGRVVTIHYIAGLQIAGLPANHPAPESLP